MLALFDAGVTALMLTASLSVMVPVAAMPPTLSTRLSAFSTALSSTVGTEMVKPLTPAVAAEQQKIADTFHALGLIPKPIRVADALPGAAKLAEAAK